MKLRAFTSFFTLILALAQPVCATGSFQLEDIMALLDQEKEIRGFLLKNLELAPGGSANRIGQAVNPNLGGARVGPYVLNAKPKGAKDWAFEIHIEVKTEYLDAAGKPVELERATSFRETFLSVRIAPRCR